MASQLPKAPAISQDLVAATSGPLSRQEQEELQRVMGSLHRSDRVETLSYAFEVALEAGEQKRGPFNVDAAVASLTGGYIKLKGNAEQIKGQRRLRDCERNPHIVVILRYDSVHDETTL